MFGVGLEVHWLRATYIIGSTWPCSSLNLQPQWQCSGRAQSAIRRWAQAPCESSARLCHRAFPTTWHRLRNQETPTSVCKNIIQDVGLYIFPIQILNGWNVGNLSNPCEYSFQFYHLRFSHGGEKVLLRHGMSFVDCEGLEWHRISAESSQGSSLLCWVQGKSSSQVPQESFLFIWRFLPVVIKPRLGGYSHTHCLP